MNVQRPDEKMVERFLASSPSDNGEHVSFSRFHKDVHSRSHIVLRTRVYFALEIRE